jgi:cupin 2 domain-containing protein
MEPQNLFASIPKDLSAEFFQTLVSSAEIRIERIVSKGHKSDRDFWYDQDRNEWVVLIKGAARLEFIVGGASPTENRTVNLKPGDYVNILAHERHRVDWTTPDEETIWLAIFYQ